MSDKFDQNLKFVLLGAGVPYKGSSQTNAENAKIKLVVLDWLLASASRSAETVVFVGGYNLDEVKEKYPHLSYVDNKDWKTTKATGSFLASNVTACDAAVVSYTDIIYRDNTLMELASSDADIIIAVDTNWTQRYDDRGISDLRSAEKTVVSGESVRQIGRGVSLSVANAEFIGLAKMSKAVLHHIDKLPEDEIQSLRMLPFSDFIETLRLSGFNIQAYDVRGEWAELNDPRDIGQFILGTKAETLMRLQNMVRKSVILDQISFRVADWESNRSEIVDDIKNKFNGSPLIIRSSALSEDNFETAGAGVYESRGDVDSTAESSIISAVEFVISSYVDGAGDNQVLVQHMLKGVVASGVVFTRTLSNASPYFVVNYDDESRSTDSITGGSARNSKTYKISRAFTELNQLPAPLTQIVEAVLEVEDLIGFDSLDVEFAVGEDGLVYLFQVRPLINKAGAERPNDRNIFAAIETAKTNFDALREAPPHIVGETLIFGAMPDWNPAEIIGVHPERLAVDLYAELILNDVWARQRAEYGYRNVRPQKLMRLFCGHPYIDVRASFNSFIPVELDAPLAGRLVEFFLNCLIENPQAHDKVEFEILPTCFDLDFARWQNVLSLAGFSDEHIANYKDALRTLTHQAIGQPHGAAEKLQVLQTRFVELSGSELGPVRKACLLLEEAKEFGTLPFAHLARDGFVAVTLLKSAVTAGEISQSAMSDFMRSLNSVTSQLTKDAAKVKAEQMTSDAFIAQYGHLRPDTYNIASPCYRANSELFLKPLLETAGGAHETPEPPHIWNEQKADFFEALLVQGVGKNAAQLEAFLVDAIEGREYSKFLFSRNLSAALELFAEFGESLGFGRAELANVPLSFFQQFDVDGNGEDFSRSVREWQKLENDKSSINKLVELPELLVTSSDFNFFSLSPSSGNFVGESAIIASCLHYHTDANEIDFKDNLVLIENADPGYDWLFGVGIAGLITKYGGANSHMAIRAAEFGLPAVIGIGEFRFNELIGANTLQLDCQSKTIRIVN
jgi:choline kinase